MNKIEAAMCQAVENKVEFWQQSNTTVIKSSVGNMMLVYLWDNLIFMEHASGAKRFTLAGWNTKTTKSRLRALGIEVYTKNKKPYFNGKPIDENEIYEVR